jgi:hypothetical protein
VDRNFSKKLTGHEHLRILVELDVDLRFIPGKDGLIQNRHAVGRPQDLADLDTLES